MDLGANLFHKVGLGDYQHDFEYEGEFDPWLCSMWENLNKVLKGKFVEKEKEGETYLWPPIYKIKFLDEVSEGDMYGGLKEIPAPHGAI